MPWLTVAEGNVGVKAVAINAVALYSTSTERTQMLHVLLKVLLLCVQMLPVKLCAVAVALEYGAVNVQAQFFFFFVNDFWVKLLKRRSLKKSN